MSLKIIKGGKGLEGGGTAEGTPGARKELVDALNSIRSEARDQLEAGLLTASEASLIHTIVKMLEEVFADARVEGGGR